MLRTQSILGLSLCVWISACGSKGSDAPFVSTSSQPPVGAVSRGDDERDEAPFAPGSADGSAIDTRNVMAFNSSFIGGRKLTSLSDSEIPALCNQARTYFFSNASATAIEHAICVEEEGIGASNEAECELLTEACLASTLFEYLECSLTGIQREGAECAATVDMYEACETEWASVARAYVGYFTCELADPTVDKDLPQQLRASLVKCEKLYEECPDLGS